MKNRMSSLKTTGLPWIPFVNSTWKITKVKNCFKISKSKAKNENPVILSLARDGIKIRDITKNEGQLATNYSDYNPVLPGDLLLNPMDLYSGANCNMSEVSGVISPAYSNLRAIVTLNPKFFDFYFKTQYWSMAMFAHGKGVSFDNRWTLNADGLLNYEIPFPPFEIQNEIVKILKKKIGIIDSLISNETKQIEKLEEYKKAVITKAVTKGLDPDAKMKDSDVEWIGKIKQDYHCEKLKFLLSSPLLYGANESGGKQEKGCTRFIRITDIDSNGNLKDTNDNQYLSASKSTGYILKNKDILFARSGGTVGKSFLYKNPGFPCSFAGYLIKAECEETLLLPEFLYSYTKSSLYEIWKNMIFVQSTIQNIGAQRYGNLDIVIPSIAEQKQIVQYIDKKCMLIDKLIDTKNRTRKQLLNFKKSLIYEYVTGKKKVSL